MFKYLRDVKENFSVASILLSTLLGNCINDNENHSDFRSLSAAFITIFKRLNDFLQINTNKPIIKNPVLPEEDFSIHWDQDKYNNFRDKMNTYYIKSKNAFNETDKKKSIELWKEVFGDEFPDIIENDKIASSIVPVASTSKPWGQ